jgi:alpha-mannosidase
MQFRFSLTSSKDYDSEAASRFGQSVRNPLLAKAVEPGSSVSGLKSRDTISADTGLGTQSVSRRMLTSITAGESLISISPSNVCIQAIKQAESGEGTVIRLREVGGKSDRATVTLPKGVFKHAWKCNLVEDASASLPVSDNRVSIDVQAKGLATILLK